MEVYMSTSPSRCYAPSTSGSVIILTIAIPAFPTDGPCLSLQMHRRILPTFAFGGRGVESDKFLQNL